MGWSSDEQTPKKEGMDLSSKILISIISCVLLIILIIIILLINIKNTSFDIIVDGKTATTTSKDKLITTIDDLTYLNIEEFAKLVNYEYHEGEYKSFTISKDKCYVQGTEETASFYLNENKVCKLPTNKLEEDYREYTVKNITESINDKMYAPIETIQLAFNVVIKETNNSLTIYTLDNLITSYDKKVKDWGYTGLEDQTFENKKSLLYGYLIVKKQEGLYKIINIDNTQEIVSDKYSSIEFSENTKEFFVTNSLGEVGIINLDGTTKIEPIYNSISVLDKNSGLYLVDKDKKYGVVKSGNKTVIYPEYDSIGLNTKNNIFNIENQYIILDTLIPVCKNNKYGAFDKEGNLILNVEYDELGCTDTNVEVNGTKKTVEPVLTIPECKGIVVKKAEKYGLMDITGKELVPVAVDSIYSITTNNKTNYFMLYNTQELNIISRLIAAGLLEDKVQTEDETTNNTANNNQNTTNNVQNNTTNTATVEASSSNLITNNVNLTNSIN